MAPEPLAAGSEAMRTVGLLLTAACGCCGDPCPPGWFFVQLCDRCLTERNFNGTRQCTHPIRGGR